MPQATVTTRGRVTIPASIRKALGLSAGERVIFTRTDCGTVVMRPNNRSFTPSDQPMSTGISSFIA